MILKPELELTVSPEETGIRLDTEAKMVYCSPEHEKYAKYMLQPDENKACTADLFLWRLDVWNTVQARILLGGAMKTITRRAFLKLASLCGAAVAGLVGLQKVGHAVSEETIYYTTQGGTEWPGYDGLAAVKWCDAPFVVPPPAEENQRQLRQCETESARYVIFRNDDGEFLYSEDDGFSFHGPMNFWDMPENARKAWWLDKVLYGQSRHETYIMQSCCGRPTTW